VSFGGNNAQTLGPPIVPMVTKVPVWESVMKANQAEFRIILRAAVPMVVGLALSSYATASFALGTAEQRVACTPDVFRLCSSEIPNVGLIISCMKANKTSLSQACRSVFDSPMSNKTASSE
jgi:hypothetical protein